MKGEVQLQASNEQEVGDAESAPLLQPPAIGLVEKDGEINDEESDTSSAACCRICLELEGSDPGDELISPCMCKGTQQFVHRYCLDHWRSVKEGFAFSHCTTCKAQFHLRTEIPEDYSWRKLKFRIFVARDVLLVFLAVQTSPISRKTCIFCIFTPHICKYSRETFMRGDCDEQPDCGRSEVACHQACHPMVCIYENAQ